VKLLFIDEKENKIPVTEKAIKIMIDRLDETDLDQAGVKLLLYMVIGDSLSTQRIANYIKSKIEEIK
jgi:hypothetical protein